ncbi:hypothetical protein ACFYY3_21365 [Streptomyces sp. NPDC001812]|uniref:hypothetical protein n=1 Tax=Streptomyces sp. NPDC001812 TaxID=3364611 RepID=UPI0036C69D5C
MTLLPVFVGLVVGWVALRGLPAHPLLPLWVRTSVFWTVPLGAVTWVVIMVADDPFLFPETDPCLREPTGEGVLGRGKGSGVSTPFPPRASCQWEDGTVRDLTPEAEFVFWVLFALTVVPLAAGLWHALRDPKSFLHQGQAAVQDGLFAGCPWPSPATTDPSGHRSWNGGSTFCSTRRSNRCSSRVSVSRASANPA